MFETNSVEIVALLSSGLSETDLPLNKWSLRSRFNSIKRLYCVEVLFPIPIVKIRLPKLVFDRRNLSLVNSDCFRPLTTCLNDLKRVFHTRRIFVVPCAQVGLEIESSRWVTLFAAVFNQMIDRLGVSVVTKVDRWKSGCAKSRVLPFQKRSSRVVVSISNRVVTTLALI